MEEYERHSYQGQKKLRQAIRRGDLKAVQKHYSFSNLTCPLLKKAFETAAALGHERIFAFFINHPVQNLLYDVGPYELVREAIKNGHVGLMNMLLDCFCKGPFNWNLLISTIEVAASKGHLGIIDSLLKYPSPPGRVGNIEMLNISLIVASQKGQLVVVNRLLEDPRIVPDVRNNAPLCGASRNGHLEVVRRLLQDPRVDPGARESKALILASMFGHLGVVERLLQDPRVNPAAQNNEASRVAWTFCHREVGERLLRDPRVWVGVKENRDILFSVFREGDLCLARRIIRETPPENKDKILHMYLELITFAPGERKSALYTCMLGWTRLLTWIIKPPSNAPQVYMQRYAEQTLGEITPILLLWGDFRKLPLDMLGVIINFIGCGRLDKSLLEFLKGPGGIPYRSLYDPPRDV